MTERKYTPFIPKENNLSTIDANDINELQRAVEELQKTAFIQADDAFLDRCFVSLAHHPDANAMIVNTMDGSLRGVSMTYRDTYLDTATRSIVLTPGAYSGYMVAEIPNETGKAMRLPVLLVDEHTDDSSRIEYEMSYDDQTYYPIRPNEAMPLEVDTERSILYLRITLNRYVEETNPRVDAWAVLYKDETFAFKFLDDGLDIGVESLWDGTIVE